MRRTLDNSGNQPRPASGNGLSVKHWATRRNAMVAMLGAILLVSTAYAFCEPRASPGQMCLKSSSAAMPIAALRADPRSDVRARVQIGAERYGDVGLHIKGSLGSVRSN